MVLHRPFELAPDYRTSPVCAFNGKVREQAGGTPTPPRFNDRAAFQDSRQIADLAATLTKYSFQEINT
jgi:hypothetical protein